jgi:hypothetical protein
MRGLATTSASEVQPTQTASHKAEDTEEVAWDVESSQPKLHLVERYLALANRNRAETLNAEMAAVRDAFKRHDFDTGSSQVQGAPTSPQATRPHTHRIGTTDASVTCCKLAPPPRRLSHHRNCHHPHPTTRLLPPRCAPVGRRTERERAWSCRVCFLRMFELLVARE